MKMKYDCFLVRKLAQTLQKSKDGGPFKSEGLTDISTCLVGQFTLQGYFTETTHSIITILKQQTAPVCVCVCVFERALCWWIVLLRLQCLLCFHCREELDTPAGDLAVDRMKDDNGSPVSGPLIAAPYGHSTSVIVIASY